MRRSTYARLRFRNVWAVRLHRHTFALQVASGVTASAIIGTLSVGYVWILS